MEGSCWRCDQVRNALRHLCQGRVYVVAHEGRVYAVAHEGRVYVVAHEGRVYVVAHEGRVYVVAMAHRNHRSSSGPSNVVKGKNCNKKSESCEKLKTPQVRSTQMDWVQALEWKF